MNSSNDGIPGVTWFLGIVLSLTLHIVIVLIAVFWGFGTPMYSGEPESIQGTLVSISELGEQGGGQAAIREEIKTQEPERKGEAQPRVQEKKPEEKIEVSKPEQKEPQEKEQKKVELKKEEPPKEEPKEEKIVLKEEKKEKKEKKEMAKKPEPTESPKTKPKKTMENKKQAFEDVKNKVISDIQKKKIIKELQDKKVASAGSSGERNEVQKGPGYSTGGSSVASTGVVAELFVRRVREEIRSKWAIPENIPIDGSLKTVIIFKLDEKGRVSDVKVDVSSGNSAFDDFCVKAIHKASPLTPPPSELLVEAKSEGLEITFTNES
jgi:TolA protein